MVVALSSFCSSKAMAVFGVVAIRPANGWPWEAEEADCEERSGRMAMELAFAGGMAAGENFGHYLK